MAKISRFIAEYADVFKGFDISFASDQDAKPPKTVIHRFVRVFRNLTDIRIEGMISYPLVEIVLIAFLAVLGGASTWLQISDFGRLKERWLRKFISLKNGTPSHDTFRRVFSLIDSKELQKATADFLLDNIYAIKKALPKPTGEFRLLNVDGKEQRGTGRNYSQPDKKPNLQTLHIYDSTNGICIYSEAINEKTNEIPVAQELLKGMDLSGCIVTFDALHMQKDTVEIIYNNKGHYVGGLKGNQAGLLEEAVLYFKEHDLLEYYADKGDFFKSEEKAHGKIEKREYYLVRPTKRKIIREWKGLKSFICCIKTITDIKTDNKTIETRYYASDSEDIGICAEAIRGHWGVENNLHWHLDYSMGEDENTTMDKKAFHNLSLMNKMALTMYKLVKPMTKVSSIRGLRKVFGWEYEGALSALLYCFDEKQLRMALESAKA